jgi:hypothetical protein
MQRHRNLSYFSRSEAANNTPLIPEATKHHSTNSQLETLLNTRIYEHYLCMLPPYTNFEIEAEQPHLQGIPQAFQMHRRPIQLLCCSHDDACNVICCECSSQDQTRWLWVEVNLRLCPLTRLVLEYSLWWPEFAAVSTGSQPARCVGRLDIMTHNVHTLKNAIRTDFVHNQASSHRTRMLIRINELTFLLLRLLMYFSTETYAATVHVLNSFGYSRFEEMLPDICHNHKDDHLWWYETH